MIKKEDVLSVANDLNFKPTDEQIKDIISLYPSAQENDPTGTWNLVVEQLLYELKVEQTKDYFEHYESLPIEIKEIVDEFCTGDNSYENCANLVAALESKGWTCEYGLDAEPFNLHKII